VGASFLATFESKAADAAIIFYFIFEGEDNRAQWVDCELEFRGIMRLKDSKVRT
jgi:hypothetical protein